MLQVPQSPCASAAPPTGLMQPGISSSDKVGTPSGGPPKANPTLAAAMAGMPLPQMLHMGPGMAGRPTGPLGLLGPRPSRLGSGLPAAPAAVSLPFSTAAMSLPGSQRSHAREICSRMRLITRKCSYLRSCLDAVNHLFFWQFACPHAMVAMAMVVTRGWASNCKECVALLQAAA